MGNDSTPQRSRLRAFPGQTTRWNEGVKPSAGQLADAAASVSTDPLHRIATEMEAWLVQNGHDRVMVSRGVALMLIVWERVKAWTRPKNTTAERAQFEHFFSVTFKAVYGSDFLSFVRMRLMWGLRFAGDVFHRTPVDRRAEMLPRLVDAVTETFNRWCWACGQLEREELSRSIEAWSVPEHEAKQKNRGRSKWDAVRDLARSFETDPVRSASFESAWLKRSITSETLLREEFEQVLHEILARHTPQNPAT